jgi:hypothetical protein
MIVGVAPNAAGAPPVSVVVPEEALYGASLGQWTLVCGGCGEQSPAGLKLDAASTELTSAKPLACGDRSG